ncbi:MAG: LysM peptidoglycan-binding domain-containing protein [Candidatus Limnocylindria bacterium]
MLEGFKDMLGVDDKEAEEKAEDPATTGADPAAPPPPASGSTASGTESAETGSTESAAPATGRTYTVKHGDNLHKIAEKFDVKWRDIAELNHLKNPDLIHPGDVFKIPDSRHHGGAGREASGQEG